LRAAYKAVRQNHLRVRMVYAQLCKRLLGRLARQRGNERGGLLQPGCGGLSTDFFFGPEPVLVGRTVGTAALLPVHVREECYFFTLGRSEYSGFDRGFPARNLSQLCS